MDHASSETNNVYRLHHEVLRRAILAAATIDAEDLESAGIELAEGWLPTQYPYAEDCLSFLDNFEFLKHLQTKGELDENLDDCLVTTISRHDVFFALALHESEAAVFLFSDRAPSLDWGLEDRVREGLKAAVAAAKAYQYACQLMADGREAFKRGKSTSLRYPLDLC
jgi:hypothetical protein